LLKSRGQIHCRLKKYHVSEKKIISHDQKTFRQPKSNQLLLIHMGRNDQVLVGAPSFIFEKYFFSEKNTSKIAKKADFSYIFK